MEKIFLAFRSRTVWTVFALIVINGVPAVTGMLPEEYMPLINGALGLLAAYFRVSPRV